MSSDFLAALAILGMPMRHSCECFSIQPLHTELSRDFDCSTVNNNCFRIPLNDKWKVSIAHPFDVQPREGYWAEFALIEGGRVGYNKDIGYGNICRFYSLEEIKGEILRLQEIASRGGL